VLDGQKEDRLTISRTFFIMIPEDYDLQNRIIFSGRIYLCEKRGNLKWNSGTRILAKTY